MKGNHKNTQHLLPSEVLSTLKLLGYPKENIISEVDVVGFSNVNIFSKNAFVKAIEEAIEKPDNGNRQLILLKVNSESRSFSDVENENNHYVAISFGKNSEGNLKLTYIDPTGKKISDSIREIITSHSTFGTVEIVSCNLALQHTDPHHEGSVYTMGGNDYDCGVLVALAANMVRVNDSRINALDIDAESSKQLGQMLRALRNESDVESISNFLDSRTIFPSNIDPITHQGSPFKINDSVLGGDLESDSENSDLDDSDSEIEPDLQAAINKSKNSLETSFERSFSKLAISESGLDKTKVDFLETHGDDSSDEEDTRSRIKKYRNVEEAWEVFSNPRVYYDGQKYPLIKQENGKYGVNITKLNLSWQNINLSNTSSLVDQSNNTVSYIYFGPEQYNSPKNKYVMDERTSPFTTENYDNLKASFELHYKGIEALYEDRISDRYYDKKRERLSNSRQLENLKAGVSSAVNQALTTLVLSVNWQGGVRTGIDQLYDIVLENAEVKKTFEDLAKEVLQKRSIATKVSDVSSLTKLRPFSEAVHNTAFGTHNQIPSLLGSVVRIAIDELQKIGAITQRGNKKDGYYWAPLSAKERTKSYEETIREKGLPKTKLGKFAYSLLNELDTKDHVVDALEAKKEHLLNDLIFDLSQLTQNEIDAKFQSLAQTTTLNKMQVLEVLDNLIVHNLEGIKLQRRAFSDNVELVQESFGDILTNIRLSNRSQSRRIKNLQQEEGDKVWSKTVTWAHAFEQGAQNHALEKETITSKAGRNSLILDFGKYEEGKRKGNTVTEGVDKLKEDLKIDDKTIAHSVIQILQGTPASAVRNIQNEMFYPSEVHSSILINIAGLLILEFKRNPNFTSFMTLDLVRSGRMSWADALDQVGRDGGMLPMSMTDAMKAARCLHDLYSPYMPHPYQIHGAEKFEVTEAKVLELITREHEIKTQWNNLHKEIVEKRENLQDANDSVSSTKSEIKRIQKEIDKSEGETKEDLKIDLESVMDDLDCYRSNRTAAKNAIKSLGSTTIQDQLESEVPSSQVQLAKTSKLSATALSKSL